MQFIALNQDFIRAKQAEMLKEAMNYRLLKQVAKKDPKKKR